MQICDPVLRYRKSGFFYNGRIFRGKSFCLVNNKKLTKITGGIISLRFYLKVKCNEQGEKEMKRKIVIGMLVLSMAVSATACSSKKEETAKARLHRVQIRRKLRRQQTRRILPTKEMHMV